jgi:dTDP-glucose 4,6-dehydratase
MKILVTGGCGFIGSNFIINQVNNNNEIVNLDKLTYAGNLDNLSSIKNNSKYVFINGDICQFDLVNNIIQKHKPDCIVHFAAESHVDRSIDNPIQFINTNLIGTASLLNAANNYYIKSKNDNFRFIHISTDEVFGSLRSKGFFTESTPYDPSSPYSATKAGSDHLVRAWNRTYGLPAIISNCSNNYGPYQFPEKLIPLMIANCIDEKPLPIYGNGKNIRDWLYVNDHCNAINNIIEDGVIGETYNIGGNNEISNIDIVKIICEILNKIKPSKKIKSYTELITFVSDRPGHDFRYAIDSTKIMNKLKWKPIETFNSGIQKTVEWYINNESWWRKIQLNNYKQQRLGIK